MPTRSTLDDPRLDWEQVARLASIHHLEPLLHHLQAESMLPSLRIPQTVQDRWEQAYFENFLFNSRALELLGSFTELCRDRRLPVVVIKGPVVMARVFVDPALRILVDLDLLCHERHLARLIQAAGEIGFGGGEENAIHHVAMRHEELPLLLELHFDLWDFLPQHRMLHQAAVESATHEAGTGFAGLAPESELTLEVAHLVSHDLRVNLKPWLDIAAHFRTSPLRTDALRAQLETWDLAQEFALVAEVVARLFGVEVPDDLRPITAPEEYVDTALQLLLSADRAPSRPALLELAVRPGLGTKLNYLRRLLLPPRRRSAALASRGSRLGSTLLVDHLAAAVRRGRTHLRRGGLALSPDLPSIKRAVYARRERDKPNRRGRDARA